MIELEVNGNTRTIEPATIDELRGAIAAVPEGHTLFRVFVDGREVGVEQIRDLDLAAVRRVEVSSAPASEIARGAVGETTEWIDRICGVLRSVSADYRLGRDREANEKLVHVIDALQVLAHLLCGIQGNIDMETERRKRFDEDWTSALGELQQAVEAVVKDFERQDSIELADRSGYDLPRALETFRGLLGQIDA